MNCFVATAEFVGPRRRSSGKTLVNMRHQASVLAPVDVLDILPSGDLLVPQSLLLSAQNQKNYESV
jgi:hypothetical protein